MGRLLQRPRTWIASCLVLTCAASALSGCTSGTADDDAGCKLRYSIGSKADDRLSYRNLDEVGKISTHDKPKIGVVLKTLSNQYWADVKRGALAAGRIHGVEVTVQAATDEASESEQLTVAQTMVNQGFDAFVISPINDANLTPAIREIKKQCKPLVDVIEPGVQANTYVGADEKQVGRQAAQHLASRLPKGAKVLHIEGQAGSQAGADRTTGFTAGVKEAGLKLAGKGVGDWDQDVAYDATEQLLQRHPDARGIYAANDTMALGSSKAVRSRGADAIVVGTDAIPAAVDLVRSGRMSATNTPFPYYQGCKAVEAALQHLSGNDAPAWLESAPTLVTKKNVDNYYKADNTVKNTGSCQPPSK